MRSYKSLLIIALTLMSLSLTACNDPEQKAKKYLKRGDVFFEKQDYTRARLEYKNAARITPANPTVFYSLGLIEEKEGNLRGAMGHYLMAEQQDASFEPAISKLAQYFLASEQHSQVQSRVDLLLTANPKNAEAHALLASLLLKKGAFEQAKAEIQQAFKYDPDNIIAFSVKAGLHLALNQPEEALENLEDGIQKNPKELSLPLLKAAVYSEQNNIPKVAETYESIFKAHPEKIRLRFDLANIFYKTKFNKEAEETLRAIILTFPENKEAKRKLSLFLEKQHGIEVAEKEIRTYIKDEPDQKILYLWLADLYVRHDLTDRAIATLENVIKGKDNDGISLNANTSLASIQLNKGDIDLANKLIKAVLSKDINNTDALFVRASLSYFQGHYQDAVADLRTIVRDKPRSTKAFHVLAETFLAQGHLDLSIDTLMQSLDIDPTNLKTSVRLAQLYVIRGDIKGARKILELVTETDPTYAIGWESTARLAIQSKDWANAASAIQNLKAIEGQDLLSTFLHGQIQDKQNKKKQAITLYKYVIEADPSAPLSEHALTALLLLSQDKKQLPDIISFISSLKTDSPTMSTVLGGLFLMLEKTQDAELAFSRAIDQKSLKQTPYISLARIALDREEFDEAIRLLEKAEKAIPSEITASMTKARILSQQGKSQEAIAVYDALLKQDPTLDAAANNLAQNIADFQYNDKQALEKARLAAERFISSKNPIYLDTLGWVYFRQDNFPQSKAILKQAIDLTEPAEPQMQYHYGVLLLKMEEKEAAKTYLTAATKGTKPYPGREEAAALLESIK